MTDVAHVCAADDNLLVILGTHGTTVRGEVAHIKIEQWRVVNHVVIRRVIPNTVHLAAGRSCSGLKACREALLEALQGCRYCRISRTIEPLLAKGRCWVSRQLR